MTTLRERALRLLARREYTRHGLALRLKQEVAACADLDALLDQLERQGYLSDQRAAEALLRKHAERYGVLRLRQDFQQQGVPAALAASLLEEARAYELKAGLAVWTRKFGQFPETAADRARQMRYLVNRGFSRSTIAAVLGGDGEEDGE
ncbi:recombination regulator RecX [mine drainage metagenome]|uniref:Regulatory protein RecX n=1 Tax=mine drainage metagenome TaxID=410659 RepID=T0Z828_9ZZZZ